MAVIGIITCEILELEFATILGSDTEIGRISVLENRQSARLIELLEAQPIHNLQRLPHVHAFQPEPNEPLEVLIRVLELGLHRNRKVLRDALSKAAHELRPHANALLLGYGLCGNALEDSRAVLDVDIPVFLPMDQDRPVDDCVALCLGGRDCYYAELRKIPGTFFLTPGWATHWKRMLDPRSGEMAQPGLKRVLAGYERALLVPTPALTEGEMLRRGEEFSRQTGLRLEVRQGTMDLLTTAWRAAKSFIESTLVPEEAETSQ
ncbi:MAG: DUF1638 domain-containing protein [Methylococcaceae bacterium]|nr:DUF1638 domain-containing protein [Methylococcaceae bacterium]